MEKEELDRLDEENVQDERSFSTFCTNASYALIAANWALFQFKQSPNNIAIILSVGLAIFFLLYKGIRQFLNLKHIHKVLDAVHKDLNAYPNAMSEQTCYGRVSDFLFKVEPLIPLLALLTFIWACIQRLN